VTSSSTAAERQIARSQFEIGPLRPLVGVADTGDLADLSAPSAGIEALRIAALALR
jgi:hypothetical protein